MSEDLVKIADKGDYHKAYRDYVEYEESFGGPEMIAAIVPFETFISELKLGYGKSKINQIARLIDTNEGIFYDNDYVSC